MEFHHVFRLLVSITVFASLASGRRLFGGLFQNVQSCPQDTPRVSCMMPPCSASNGCKAFPDAECRNNYCGGCLAQFWVGSNDVTSQCDGLPGGDLATLKKSSADGCAPVRCFMNPCDSATCPAKPSASCRQSQCDCVATFWEGNTEVTDQCTPAIAITRMLGTNNGGMMSTSECGDLPKVQCSMSPCDVESCPQFPQAQCRTNYCGTCGAEFWVGSKEVTSECNTGGLVLNTGSNADPLKVESRRILVTPKPTPQCLSSCFFPPCRLSYCAAFPNAECRNNYCEGCRAQYYMGNSEVTTMCNDRVPSLTRMFSRRRPQRTRSIFPPWMAFLDSMF